MHPAPDMSLWQGRIDSQEGAGALRWHQWIRPYHESAGAASVLLGFASDEGVRRNQGRQGARQGPPALRRALANLAWHGEQALYDAGDIEAAEDLEGAQERYARRVAELLGRGHQVVGLGGGHEIAYASFSGLAHHLGRDGGRHASASSISTRTSTCAMPNRPAPARRSARSPSTARPAAGHSPIAAWASAA